MGRKDRERAAKGLLFRGGKLVPREEVERPAHDRKLGEVTARLQRYHNLTIIGGKFYKKKPTGPSESDVQIDPDGRS